MKTRISKFNFYLFVFVVSSIFNFMYGQEIGKIYSSSDAENLFGKVTESKSISVGTLENALEKTENYVMFRLFKGSVTILGDNRTLLFSEASYSENNEVFNVFSKSKVMELISLNKEDKCILENRTKTFTLTKGNFTLDLTQPCPPICP